MLYVIPDYYKKFQCTADQCEDTCCAGWQIVVDKKSLKKYKAVKSPYRKALRKNVNWRQETFRQDKEKRCAFLNNDNLCDMYIHLGEGSLCKTCRLYPRHIEEFEGVREITLSVSCPEVARILLNKTEKVRFLSKENDRDEEYEDFDPFLYSTLLDARDVILKILQNRELPVKVRAGLLYGIAHDIQMRVDRQELFSCNDVLEKYKSAAAKSFLERRIRENESDIEKIFSFSKEMFENLFRLEYLKEDWYCLLMETKNRLFAEDSPVAYWQITEEFDKWMQKQEFSWEIQKEQLLVYFVFTYFCGSVYDGNILAKAQMAIIMVDLLEEMLKVRWFRNEKMLDMEDIIELTYRFSREVEHSDINLKRMESFMPKKHGRF